MHVDGVYHLKSRQKLQSDSVWRWKLGMGTERPGNRAVRQRLSKYVSLEE